jgi:hypothetical protein
MVPDPHALGSPEPSIEHSAKHSSRTSAHPTLHHWTPGTVDQRANGSARTRDQRIEKDGRLMPGRIGRSPNPRVRDPSGGRKSHAKHYVPGLGPPSARHLLRRPVTVL